MYRMNMWVTYFMSDSGMLVFKGYLCMPETPINNNIYIPTIGQTLNSLKEIVSDNRFFLDVSSSIIRTIVSFLVAFLSALILGLLAYTFRTIRNFLKPINALVQSIPNMVLIVLALIWFNKNNAPYIVGFTVVFPILYDSILGAITGIDKSIIEMANIYKINIVDKIYYISFRCIA